MSIFFTCLSTVTDLTEEKTFVYLLLYLGKLKKKTAKFSPSKNIYIAFKEYVMNSVLVNWLV